MGKESKKSKFEDNEEIKDTTYDANLATTNGKRKGMDLSMFHKE